MKIAAFNPNRKVVRFIEFLNAPKYCGRNNVVLIALGLGAAGQPMFLDLKETRHLLIAGAIGSGKTVALHAMLMSLLLKFSPSQLRLILIAPQKPGGLSHYCGVPHLLSPLITDAKDALRSLNWLACEMEYRLKQLKNCGMVNIERYNSERNDIDDVELCDLLFLSRSSCREPYSEVMPRIVMVVDEFASLMELAGKRVGELIKTITKHSLQVGIHLIFSTQRTSADVITHSINASFPTRVSMRVNCRLDSLILGVSGAEKLPSYGDMLLHNSHDLGPDRTLFDVEVDQLQGVFVSEDEVKRVCGAWREQDAPDYVDYMLHAFEYGVTREESMLALIRKRIGYRAS